MTKFIKGNYRKSIFKSNTGYVIGLFKVRDTNDDKLKEFINKTITFTGYFPELNEDDIYLFYGNLVNNPKYGNQYQVDKFEKIRPEDKDGIIEFLSSDLFIGIGEKVAKSIVDTLGEKALDKIIEDPDALNLVPKLTSKKAKVIYDTLIRYEESHETIVYLTDLGFNMKDSLIIYNTYKKNTIINIEHDIYMLLDDINELSFVKIDSIRKKLNIPENDEKRIKACIIYIIKQITYTKGDTYLLYDEIKDNLYKYLKNILDEQLLKKYLEELIHDDKIVIEEEKYYLTEVYESEENIAKYLLNLVLKKPHKYKNINDDIKKIEEVNKIKYNEKQKYAIKESLQKNVVLITGGPGTGKTTIIKAIVELYQQMNDLTYEQMLDTISLLAPTGRASKRLSETTNLKASTIHRFLKWNKDSNSFGVNEYNKDQSKLIIIDEVSMIDTFLFDSLIKGITSNVKIILVGDYHQLPSVGMGQILKDLIESNVILTIKLDLLYRQNENSYIPVLASEIKNDNITDEYFEAKDDYTFLECPSMYITESIKKISEKMIDKGYDYKRLQIMAPTYNGINGIDKLNKELQPIFNSYKKEKQEYNYGDILYRVGDKVLQLVNLPDDNIYNGDIGVIEEIVPANISASKNTEIYINFDENIVKYYPKDLINIKHGFVISIHKSQGSEFEAVIIPMCPSYGRMLYKRLIYTAVTRAKRKLIILGEKLPYINSVKNSDDNRKTGLKEKLISFSIK